MWDMGRGQRTTLRSQFILSNFMWVSGTNLESSGLHSKCLLPEHFPGKVTSANKPKSSVHLMSTSDLPSAPFPFSFEPSVKGLRNPACPCGWATAIVSLTHQSGTQRPLPNQ